MGSSSSTAESENNTEKQTEDYDWVGNASTSFQITSNQLEEAIDLREEWREEIETEKWGERDWKAIKIAPKAEDSRRNSHASGDQNILHHDSDVVEDFASEYSNFVRQPQQSEDVVINQGMSMIDTLATEFEEPLQSLEGLWTEMVYASETGRQPDQIVLSNNNSEGNYTASLFPGGRADGAREAAKITPEYAHDTEEYHELHNEYLTAVQSQAVGRSFNERSDVRNGELLVWNKIDANQPIDWDRVEKIDFDLEEIREEDGNPQVELEWSVDIEYDEEVVSDAITYQEKSMYVEGFEDLEKVEEEYSQGYGVFAPIAATSQVNASFAKASINRWKKMNPWMDS